MADTQGDRGDVAIVAGGTSGPALRDMAAAAGWRRGARDALVRLVDARDDPALVAAEDARAIDDGAALLAIVADDAAADRAYAAGATHVLTGEVSATRLARALRFAGRHARRVRGMGRGRRSGEGAPGAAARFVASRPAEAPMTVALIALTRFDVVNAAFGRASGDALIAAAIARIAAALPAGAPETAPETAVVERTEGALIAVAMAIEPAAAERVLEDIDARLAGPFAVGRADANLGIRSGAAHRAAGEPARSLWRRAEEALDAAHRSDGGRIRRADPPRALPEARLAADLHRAIDRREIDILFQPQLAFADDAVVGVEALARWEHPEHGALGADPLFAAAARADLGLALSEHIQALAAAKAAAWPASLGHLRVSLNVTAAEVARAAFAERFLTRIAENGLAAGRVTAEITETELLADRAAAATQLAELRAAGVRVAIDDFGTGYSSLSYLAALPLDYIKFDRGMTQAIDDASRDRIVLRGAIAIARALGLDTIVEGVESEAQRALLAAEGCTLYQGFLRAGPLDDGALRAMVEDR